MPGTMPVALWSVNHGPLGDPFGLTAVACCLRGIPSLAESKDGPRIWLECGAILIKPFFGATHKPLKTRHKIDVTEIRKVRDFRLTGVEAEAYIPAIDAPFCLRPNARL